MIRACTPTTPTTPTRRGGWPCLLLLVLLLPVMAAANSKLALDRGCINCHGEPPRRGLPSLAQLAASYARYQGQNEAAHKLAGKLREGGMFGHIAAHERLSEEDAEALMQWLIEGAR